MTDSFDLILRGGTVALPQGIMTADIGVKNGRIAEIGVPAGAKAAEEMDCTGLHVLPGVIDSQVHFREPGNEHKEDLATGTMSAAAGGVTSIFEMPNTSPLTTSLETMADKVDRATGRAWCDFAFFMGGTAENASQMATLEKAPGCCGVKIFMGSSTGNLLVAEDEPVAAVLANGMRRVSVHSEDEAMLKERFHMVEGGADVKMHPEWRSVEVAMHCTKRLINLARKAGRRVHVLHITTADEMLYLAGHKDLATVEVTPQHLTLSAPECYERLGTLAQMNPPVRSEEHRKGLWRGIEQGVVDVLGSDHAPHTMEEKQKPYPTSPSGMTGVQTLVPLMLDHVNKGNLTLERFVDLTSAGPQRVFNIAGKGRIAAGYDADFTIVDMKAKRRIENSWIKSKAGWTPFDGMEVSAWPVATVIRGNIVMRDDELLGDAAGVPVRFNETLKDAA